MENSIYNLDKGRWDKEAPMKVAETRLFNRHARPNVEMCRDETSHRYEFTINETLLSSIDPLHWYCTGPVVQTTDYAMMEMEI